MTRRFLAPPRYGFPHRLARALLRPSGSEPLARVPSSQQAVLLNTIDTFLKGARAS